MVVASMIVSAIVIFGALFLVSRFARRRRRAPSAEFSGAPIAFGTVTSMQDTHRMIHYQHYVDVGFDVACPDGRRFATTQRILMHPQIRSVVQAGTIVPVRYRPD